MSNLVSEESAAFEYSLAPLIAPSLIFPAVTIRLGMTPEVSFALKSAAVSVRSARDVPLMVLVRKSPPVTESDFIIDADVKSVEEVLKRLSLIESLTNLMRGISAGYFEVSMVADLNRSPAMELAGNFVPGMEVLNSEPLRDPS